jgi:putative phage-type endonuclease
VDRRQRVGVVSLSPDQLARRLAGITATDIAALCGVHPKRSAVQVWQEKRGEAPPWVDTDRTRWGDALEPLVRADYAQRHRVRVEEPGTLAHPDAEWMLATPDGVAYAEGGIEPLNGLEIKTHTIRLAHLYGAEGTDEVPPHELCQCAWGMAVTGLERWDLVAFIDNQPREYVIERDDEVIGHLTERAERFLVDNVRGGVAPDPDGSDAYDEWLKTRWARNTEILVDIDALGDAATMALVSLGRKLREQEAAVVDELQEIEQHLKARIGDAAGLTWKDANGKQMRLTWKRNRPGRRVDVAGMATDLRNRAGLAAAAHVREIREVLPALMKMGGHIGSSTVSGVQLAKIIEQLTDDLTGIARATDKAYTTEIPGNRPFTWPRQWRARAERKEQ